MLRPLGALLGLVLAGALLPGPSSSTPAGAAPGAAAGAATSVSAAPGGRPNVVVVMADDMRVDDLRYAPQVRRLLGRDGLTFRNSFSPYPLCCPARASFLTGMYAHNHRVYWHEAPYAYASFDDSRTLATALHDAGYRTGFVGKYLNRYGRDRSRVSGRPSYRYVPRGWTDWRATISNPHRDGIHGDAYDYFDTPFNVGGRVVNRFRGRYQTDVVGDMSLDMARRLGRGRDPFFLYVSHLAPHFGGPYERGDTRWVRDDRGVRQDVRTPARPAWVRGRFDHRIPRAAGLPRGGGPSEARVGDKPRALSRTPEPNRRERRAMRDLTRQRAEAVYVMDRQVGRLVRSLKRSGEWADTVMVFTSDNGYFLGEHRRRSGKIRAHEPSLRVPLLVTGPGLRRGEVRDDPITTVDLAATIVDLAGAEAPRLADGTSRVRTLTDGDQGWTTPVLTEATFTGGRRQREPGFHGERTSIGVRTARYSLIRNRTGEHELYDLLRDPLQQRNVVDDPSYDAVLAELGSVWWRLRDCRGASCRVPLPADLQADPEELSRLTDAYWRGLRAVYGFGQDRTP